MLRTPPSLPSTFTIKKSRILSKLAIPESKYSDKSPKGTVDAGIRDLIEEINAYEGLVTTSSCAGRVSVFVEGGRAQRSDKGVNGAEEGVEVGESSRVEKERDVDGGGGGGKGGKGGGKWLFVSHEPIADPASRASKAGDEGSFMKLFGLASPSQPVTSPETTLHHRPPTLSGPAVPRLVRLSFEPLILHILCASLSHARPLLAAAISAGFRESGVQSLKNLDDADACPMIAVRSAGLGLEGVVGKVRQTAWKVRGVQDDGEVYEAVVDEGYLELMVRVMNGRFAENEGRRERFRGELRRAMGRASGDGRGRGDEWEDAETRMVRKRGEGLRKQQEKNRREEEDDYEALDSGDDLNAWLD